MKTQPSIKTPYSLGFRMPPVVQASACAPIQNRGSAGA